MKKKERIHGGNIYEIAQKYNLKAEEILDFSASVSPLGVPGAVMRAIQASLGRIAHYPDPACKDFRQVAASQLGVESENILAGNGAAELIYLVVRMINPRCTLIPVPTFSEYGYAVSSAGGKLRYFKLQPQNDRFVISVDDFCQSIAGADLAFICNPNNPTGTLLQLDELNKIIEAGKENRCFIVIDEAYLEFVKGGGIYSMVNKISDYDNLLVLKSLTKAYSLPGLRMGYAIGPKDIILRMNNLRDPWSVNALAQAAGVAALRDSGYLAHLQEFVWEERQYLYEQINQLPGFKAYIPTANYILVNTYEAGMNASHLHKVLARSGILIRDCTSFQGMGPYYFRVAVRTRTENSCLIQALKDLLEGRGVN